jgi:hypothetical protein
VPLEALFGFGLNARFYSRTEFFTALGAGRLRTAVPFIGKVVPAKVWRFLLGSEAAGADGESGSDFRVPPLNLPSPAGGSAKAKFKTKTTSSYFGDNSKNTDNSSRTFRFRDAISTGFVYAIAHGAGVAAFVYVNITFAALAKSAKVPLTLSFAMYMQKDFRPSWQEVVGVG